MWHAVPSAGQLMSPRLVALGGHRTEMDIVPLVPGGYVTRGEPNAPP
jgi:hypothetical protein